MTHASLWRSSRWRGLWQRLTLSYVVVTVVAVLAIDLGFRLFDWLVLRRSFAATEVAFWAETVADDLASTDLRGRSSTELAWRMGQLHQQLSDVATRTYGFFVLQMEPAPMGTFSLLLVDETGAVLASDPPALAPPGSASSALLRADDAQALARALTAPPGGTQVVERDPAHATVIAPLYSDGRRTGAVVVRTDIPTLAQGLWRYEVASLLSGVGGATVLFGVIGVGFGVLTAVRLTRRLRGIGAAAEAWSRGEFSTRADDSSPDEIGQLARRLNAMSDDLQSVLQVRQELAAVDERHRLARDLHDAVKQQVFALGLQLAAARNSWDSQPAAARQRIEEAERLVRAVQRELVDLIRQLRPADDAPRQATDDLRALVVAWSRQHDIPARLEGVLPVVPASVADTVMRIVQEALANVARHSGASRVVVRATATPNNVSVSVVDDGRGLGRQRITEGSGLRNMRERASTLPDGDLHVESTGDSGTAVHVRFQLSPEQAPA